MGVPGSVAHFQEMLHPMAKFQTVEEIQQFPYPDFAEDYRWNGVPKQVQEMIKNASFAFIVIRYNLIHVPFYVVLFKKLLRKILQQNNCYFSCCLDSSSNGVLNDTVGDFTLPNSSVSTLT